MSKITIRTSSICDKAGRPYNQDNFWLCPDLSHYQATNSVILEEQDCDISLSDKGALLVVADGMGGMNAGEVASQIIIDSIKQSFINTKSLALDNKNEVTSFIKKAIIDADENVKKHAAENPETAGMGSTIVLAWILKQTVYVGWCGDSRAYCYNPVNGLVRLSHDHSYVQSLVDNGSISEEDAFDHPNSNIITRSLGDSGEKAKPEVKSYPVHNGDIYLLCTDGLCGVLRDNEIEEIMSQSHQSVDDCLKSLWNNGKEVGWTDNVTIELAKIVNGGVNPKNVAIGYDNPKSNSISEKKTNKKWITVLLSIIILLIIGVSILFVEKKQSTEAELEEVLDSLHKLIDSLEMSMYRMNDVNDSLTNLIYEYSATSILDKVEPSKTPETNEFLNGIDNIVENTETVDSNIQDNGLTPIRQTFIKD